MKKLEDERARMQEVKIIFKSFGVIYTSSQDITRKDNVINMRDYPTLYLSTN
jgi:hypothetical protein